MMMYWIMHLYVTSHVSPYAQPHVESDIQLDSQNHRKKFCPPAAISAVRDSTIYIKRHCRSDHLQLMRSLQRIQLWIRQLTMLQPTRSTVAVIGTTGVGKSQLGIELCKALQGEVINADSMQVMSLANLETTRQNHLFGAQGVQRSGYYYQQGDREWARRCKAPFDGFFGTRRWISCHPVCTRRCSQGKYWILSWQMLLLFLTLR